MNLILNIVVVIAVLIFISLLGCFTYIVISERRRINKQTKGARELLELLRPIASTDFTLKKGLYNNQWRIIHPSFEIILDMYEGEVQHIRFSDEKLQIQVTHYLDICTVSVYSARYYKDQWEATGISFEIPLDLLDQFTMKMSGILSPS